MAHDNDIVLKPGEVRGVVGKANAHIDRHFYLHDQVTDIVWEADGYKQPKEHDAATDAPDHWEIFLLCPCCQQHLRIDTKKKPIEITEHGIETGEPIACGAWLQDVEGYTGYCPFKAELEPPKTPEYGEVLTDLGLQRVRVDAWIRRAF